MTRWWSEREPRERSLIAAAAVVVGLLTAWLWLVEPAREARAALAAEAARKQALLEWLQAVEPDVRRLREAGGGPRSLQGRSALSVIDESARAAGLAGSLKRIEPAGERRHRVVFESAEFPGLMSWLASLTRERPFAVAEFSADRSGAGRVDATVVLETGGP